MASLGQAIRQLENADARNFMSLADASRIAGHHATEQLDFYSGGAVVGWLLDLKIRTVTRGRHSLDDVMRQLYAESRRPGYAGYVESDIGRVIESETGLCLRTYLSGLVHSRGRFAYDALLADTGLDVMENPGTDDIDWIVEVRSDVTPEQELRIEEWLTGGATSHKKSIEPPLEHRTDP
jgi:predicted metalloprotease with PDZ domain